MLFFSFSFHFCFDLPQVSNYAQIRCRSSRRGHDLRHPDITLKSQCVISSAPADEIDTQFSVLDNCNPHCFLARAVQCLLRGDSHGSSPPGFFTTCSSHVWCGSTPLHSRHVCVQVSACGDAGSCVPDADDPPCETEGWGVGSCSASIAIFF